MLWQSPTELSPMELFHLPSRKKNHFKYKKLHEGMGRQVNPHTKT